MERLPGIVNEYPTMQIIPNNDTDYDTVLDLI